MKQMLLVEADKIVETRSNRSSQIQGSNFHLLTRGSRGSGRGRMAGLRA